MSFARELGLWAFLGAITAGVGLRLRAPDAPAPPPATAPAVAAPTPAEAPDCPGVDPARAERLTALEAALSKLALEAAVIEGQNVAAEGAMLAWPEPTPPHLRPEVVEAALGALTGAAGGRVAELDCGEYPCVAVLLVEGGVSDALDRAYAVSDGLSEGDYPGLRMNSGISQGEEEGDPTFAFLILAIGDPLEGDAAHRVNNRMQSLMMETDFEAALDDAR